MKTVMSMTMTTIRVVLVTTLVATTMAGPVFHTRSPQDHRGKPKGQLTPHSTDQDYHPPATDHKIHFVHNSKMDHPLSTVDDDRSGNKTETDTTKIASRERNKSRKNGAEAEHSTLSKPFNSESSTKLTKADQQRLDEEAEMTLSPANVTWAPEPETTTGSGNGKKKDGGRLSTIAIVFIVISAFVLVGLLGVACYFLLRKMKISNDFMNSDRNDAFNRLSLNDMYGV